MSDKPSLYVVEKKEVIILVMLFVLVTVLSFTLGVRYGESVGKKIAHEQEAAAREHGDESSDGAGGTLGKGKGGEPGEGGKGEPTALAKEEHKEGAAGEGKDAKAVKGEVNPEAAATKPTHGGGASHELVDKNSDEYLLNALKDAGVEPPGGKAPKDAKLPEEVKMSHPVATPKAGSYVIQVGSHPTRMEAESQVKQLKAHKLQAEILPPFKDRQGEWHRVVIGSYKSKHDAERDAAAWKSKGAVVSFFVWRLP